MASGSWFAYTARPAWLLAPLTAVLLINGFIILGSAFALWLAWTVFASWRLFLLGLVGVAGLPLAQHHVTLLPLLATPVTILQDGINFFYDIFNVPMVCVNAAGDLWNTIWSIIQILTQIIFGFFGYEIYPWLPGIAREAHNDIIAAAVVRATGATFGDEKLDRDARFVERKWKALQRQEQARIDVNFLCDALFGLRKFIVALLIIFQDALLTFLTVLTQVLLEADFSFIIGFVEWIADTLLSLIAPCLTPLDEFPEIFWVCVCPNVYSDIDQVSGNIIAAFAGCICQNPDIDSIDNPIDDLVLPCLAGDTFQGFLDQINKILDELGVLGDAIQVLLNGALATVFGLLGIVGGLIDDAQSILDDLDIFDLFRRDAMPGNYTEGLPPETAAEVLVLKDRLNALREKNKAAKARMEMRKPLNERVFEHGKGVWALAKNASDIATPSRFNATNAGRPLLPARMCGMRAPPAYRLADMFSTYAARSATEAADSGALRKSVAALREMTYAFMRHAAAVVRHETPPIVAAREIVGSVNVTDMYVSVVEAGERVRKHYEDTGKPMPVAPLIAKVNRAHMRFVAVAAAARFVDEAVRVASISEEDHRVIANIVTDMYLEIERAETPAQRDRMLRAAHEQANMLRASNFGSFGVQAEMEMVFALAISLIFGCGGLCGGTCRFFCATLAAFVPLLISLLLLFIGPVQTFFLDGSPLGFDFLTPFLQLTAESWNGGFEAFDFAYFSAGLVDITIAQSQAAALFLLRSAMCFVPIPIPPLTCPPEPTADQYGEGISGFGDYLRDIFVCDPTIACSTNSPEGFLCRCPSTIDPDIWRTATDDDPCPGNGLYQCWGYWPRGLGFLPAELSWTSDINCNDYGYELTEVLPTFVYSHWYTLVRQYIVTGWQFTKDAFNIAWNGTRFAIIGMFSFMLYFIPGVGALGPLGSALTIASGFITSFFEQVGPWLVGVFGRLGSLPWIGFVFDEIGSLFEPATDVPQRITCMVVASPVVMIDLVVLELITVAVISFMLLFFASGFAAALFALFGGVGETVRRPVVIGAHRLRAESIFDE